MKEKLKLNIRRVSLKQLRALAAVVRSGTVTGAAETLSVTPPAVTMQMRQLEDNICMPLVDRTGKALRPTDAGQYLLETINRIENALGECASAIEALSGIEGGHVSVGVVSTAKYFAPRALAAFAESHPKVDMRLSVGNRSETIAGLRNYDFDFAVTGRPPNEFKVESAAIGNHPHVIIGPPGHFFAGKKGLTLKRFADETFLLREQGSGTRLLMERLFAGHGLTPKLGMQITSNETIKQAVMAGLGIALISAHTVASELADGRLVMFEVTGLPVVRQWFVVKRREKHLLPAARTLWDFFTNEGARFLPHTPAAGQTTVGAASPPARGVA